jgi:hydrogenase nickel incorporation protein HypA/HybF
MHESGLIQDALDQAADAARRAGASRIEQVNFAIADEGHQTAEIVREMFSALSVGTIAEGAQVAVEVTLAGWRCIACGTKLDGARASRPRSKRLTSPDGPQRGA